MQELSGHEEGQHPDRHVDVEDPRPAVVVGKPSAQGRADRRPQQNGDPEVPHRLTLLVRRERLPQHGLRDGLHQPGADALHDAEEDQHGQGRAKGRRPTEETVKIAGRRGRDRLRPMHRGQPGGEREDHHDGDQVAGGDPTDFGQAWRRSWPGCWGGRR